MSKKNRERRRSRQELKRQPPAPRERIEPAEFVHDFEKQLGVPEPGSWPGACDPGLARPDLVKLALSGFAIDTEPGRSKCRQLERRLADGVLNYLPNLKDWAMEEFLWHGLPGDSWNPIEAFLAREQERFSPAAAAQLRRWKEARIGFFEVGAVAADRVTLREVDPAADGAIGPDFQAIVLNSGGASFYRDYMDDIHLTYVAPWAPDEALFCAMGYGPMLTPQSAPACLPLLGLRQPDVVARPLPWKTNPTERVRYSKEWRQRNWPAWLAEHLVFPFRALIAVPDRTIQVHEVRALLPATPEEFRDLGLYFEIDVEQQLIAVGATSIIPIDPTSSHAQALDEYRAYRDLVGLPRAVR